jgi:tRNA (cmo5U34)-methyltransferase
MTNDADFSFAKYAADFDRHISSSIRGYGDLRDDCVSLSQYFIQKDSNVLDVGCSSGEFLRSVRDRNQKRFASVKYTGLDVEGEFKDQWRDRRARNLTFKKVDARTYGGYENLSLAFSLFTLQFLPEKDRLPLVTKIYEGLNEGGAFILSEKVHAKNAKIQEMLTFTYYDFKRRAFSPQEILNKERSIRSQMHLWSEYKLFEMLRAAGFVASNMQLFWRNHLFIGILAWKPPNYRKR